MAEKGKIRMEKRGEYMAVEGDAGNVCAELAAGFAKGYAEAIAEKQRESDMLRNEIDSLASYVVKLALGKTLKPAIFFDPYIQAVANSAMREILAGRGEAEINKLDEE